MEENNTTLYTHHEELGAIEECIDFAMADETGINDVRVVAWQNKETKQGYVSVNVKLHKPLVRTALGKKMKVVAVQYYSMRYRWSVISNLVEDWEIKYQDYKGVNYQSEQSLYNMC